MTNRPFSPVAAAFAGGSTGVHASAAGTVWPPKRFAQNDLGRARATGDKAGVQLALRMHSRVGAAGTRAQIGDTAVGRGGSS